MKKIIFASLTFTALIIGAVVIISPNNPQKSVQSVKISKQPSKVIPNLNYFSYQGQVNVDALTLLKQFAIVKQDSSGLITSINGREAQARNREFWAFYINGKLSEVGPHQYITKDTDIIEWKIQNF
jgi:hypothetical protein